MTSTQSTPFTYTRTSVINNYLNTTKGVKLNTNFTLATFEESSTQEYIQLMETYKRNSETPETVKSDINDNDVSKN